MEATQNPEIERVRTMAESLDCLIEEDFQLLSNVTPLTVEAWRKRGTGPQGSTAQPTLPPKLSMKSTIFSVKKSVL